MQWTDKWCGPQEDSQRCGPQAKTVIGVAHKQRQPAVWSTSRQPAVWPSSKDTHRCGPPVRWGNPANSYYDLPCSLQDAVADPQWHKSAYDPGLKVDMVSHFRDPRFFLLFDAAGSIAGVSSINKTFVALWLAYTVNNIITSFHGKCSEQRNCGKQKPFIQLSSLTILHSFYDFSNNWTTLEQCEV
ncbi:hypothetical protein J6590_024803 [Homalodisca vitripennis]|nr:hypothetical protein J6590_024803 [Homalodisca vitripennis]